MRKTRGLVAVPPIGLILAHPDKFQGPGFLVLAKTQG